MQPRRGRPSDPLQAERRRRFIAAVARDAGSLEAAMREAGIDARQVVRLLDEIGVTPQLVIGLLVAADDERAVA